MEIDKLQELTVAEIQQGYVLRGEKISCLFCDTSFEEGLIYEKGGVYYTAEKFMKKHIADAHGSVFKGLIEQDKKVTGLSEHQAKLMTLFYEGATDAEIQKNLKIGSASTIRNHRHLLREKERQAKMLLALSTLMREQTKDEKAMVTPHKTAKMVDKRYEVMASEQSELLKKYFTQGLNGPVTTIHMKEKSKLVVLRHILNRFDSEMIYTEKEVNEILKTVHSDFVHLRRYLIEYGFMDRKNDGSAYWVKKKEGEEMAQDKERRKELVMAYKETKPEACIYQIQNLKNGKIAVFSTPNVKTVTGRMMELKNGTHRIKALQEDWLAQPEEDFKLTMLEVFVQEELDAMSRKDALKRKEQAWIEKLQPFGDKGYHKQPNKPKV